MEIRRGTLVVVVDNEIGPPCDMQKKDELGVVLTVRPGVTYEEILVRTESGERYQLREKLDPLAQAHPTEADKSPEELLKEHISEAMILLARRVHALERQTSWLAENKVQR